MLPKFISGPKNAVAHKTEPFPTGDSFFASIPKVSVSHAAIWLGCYFNILTTFSAYLTDLTIVIPGISIVWIFSFVKFLKLFNKVKEYLNFKFFNIIKYTILISNIIFWIDTLKLSFRNIFFQMNLFKLYIFIDFILDLKQHSFLFFAN